MASNGHSDDVVLGVVGCGFGGLQVYAAAIYLGFAPEQIGIFGDQPNPAHAYQQYAWNLGQTVLRSESESQFLPADWPTFAELDAFARRDPSGLLRSAARRENPGVPEVLTELGVVVRGLGYERRVLGGARVGWLVRQAGPPPHFELYDDQGAPLGRAKHLALSPGHGPLSFPGIYGQARRDPALADRIVQSYEPKRYRAGGTYLSVGSGIASVNEWVNMLDAGAKCIALRRNPQPDEQDLNVPRCLFDGSGIDAFQGLTFEQRLDFLGEALKGTAPTRHVWRDTIRDGHEHGRFEERIGSVTAIESGPAGLRLTLEPHGGGEAEQIEVTGIVLGTGFVKSAGAIPLLRRLARTYDVPIENGRIRLKTNLGIPPLDREDSRLALMGLSGNTVVPNGDTISGLKYMGRRFVGDVARAEHIRYRGPLSRIALQLRLARQTARELRKVHKARQLA